MHTGELLAEGVGQHFLIRVACGKAEYAKGLLVVKESTCFDFGGKAEESFCTRIIKDCMRRIHKKATILTSS